MCKMYGDGVKMSEQVYCNWVNSDVDMNDLHPMCHEHFIRRGDGTIKCIKCELSPMITNGMPVKDMLRNLRGE